jgi:D-alanyl-D-alanine carboxypeptidase (penicillin-binding protein 5/6)
MNKMKKIIVTLLLLFFCNALLAAPQLIPSPPKIKARGYMLVDFTSGHVIAESNANERMEPASLTKMMTSYVLAHEISQGRMTLDEEVRISEKAWRMPGSRMFIEVGKRIAVEDLLKGMIIQSGNDATVALAEHVAGSEDAFAALMNAHAQRLGLTGTHFVNSTGMPHKEHYSTPRDLVYLARVLIRDFPEHYKWYAIKEMTYNGIKQSNRNRLLWRSADVDGVKTGHTESAGYCLVASAMRDGMRLLSVVLGTKSENARADESQKLLTYGFRFFETRQLFASGESLKTVRVWKGESEELKLGLHEDLLITFPRGQYDKLKAHMNIDEQIMAPISEGEKLGSVNVTLGGDELASRDLIALDNVGEGGLWHTLVDEVKLLFE